ncbi:MAG: sigma-70 family RNA polymerase sigma factor [Saprospiraceae bacterium]|nr:sigma-70 family RNA polymerase sigma factor [Saprospiraceae bacterium]
MTEKEAVERCRAGDQSAYAWVYKTFWPEFSRWIQKQGCPAHLAGEVYNQTVLAFYQNLESGRLQQLWSGLKTYLFQIGKNQWLAMARGETRRQSRLDEFLSAISPAENPFETEDQELILQRVEKGIAQLGMPCTELLTMSFQFDLPDREIAERTAYKNTDSVKTARWKCLEKLRQLLFVNRKKA